MTDCSHLAFGVRPGPTLALLGITLAHVHGMRTSRLLLRAASPCASVYRKTTPWAGTAFVDKVQDQDPKGLVVRRTVCL